MTNAVKQYVCDICAKDGVATSFKAPTALGMHKRQKHGILGSSPASKQYREAKEAAAKVAAKTANSTASSSYKMTEEQRAKAREYAANRRARLVAAKASYTGNKATKHELVAINKGAYTNGEAIALITVGRIQAICEAEAEKHNISRESFTKRCSELFFASQVRQ